uniref:CSON008474 protein n=1 Tax=Culicoides sonorensis TaxID=179676 RepID=A0A336LKK4_CULSO
MKNIPIFLLILSLLSYEVQAGIIAAGICYSGYAAVAVACFSAAGVVFGTVKLIQIKASPKLSACNGAFGTCERACMSALSH